jgi:Na+-transporting methylmalonyl-CoA/oxaloacetate decarboxylase gamma subunit
VQIGDVLVTAPNSSEGTEQPTTSSLKAADIALSDPLRAETRKARLYLLGVSTVGITIVYTGLVPQKITTLGLTFGEADRQSLLGILAVVILYFLLTFATYGVSDFIYWRRAYRNAEWSEVLEAIEAAERARQMAVQKAIEAAERAGQMAEQEAPEPGDWARQMAELSAMEPELTTEQRARRIFSEARNRRNVVASQAQQAANVWTHAFTPAPAERAIMTYSALSPTVASVRALIEFLLPLLVGLYAIYALVGLTVLGVIIGGVSTVAGVWLAALAVRRRGGHQEATQAATKATTEAAQAATMAATQNPQRTTDADTEEAPEEPQQEQPRDR